MQDAECLCSTAVCGAGMLDIGAAVAAAQRPAAVATVRGQVGVGRSLTLDGTASTAASGRALASHAWTVLSASGGARTPVLNAPAAASTTLLSPESGSVTLRLTVTDDLGASDTADVTIDAASSGGASSSTAPPPVTPPSAQGGGGDAGLPLLVLLAALQVATTMRRGRRARAEA